MREREIRTARARRQHGDANLDQDLIGMERGREQPRKELLGADRPAALGPLRDDLALQRQYRGGIVGGGGGVREAAPDRSEVAHLNVADGSRCFRQHGRFRADLRRRLDRPVGCERPDAEYRTGIRDVAQAVDASQVDQVGRRDQTQLQQRQQAVPPGEQLGIRQRGQQAHGLRHRRGCMVFELSRDHGFTPCFVVRAF